MGAWSIRQFKGISPVIDAKLLGVNQAQLAVNCDLQHGTLRPLPSNLTVPGALSKAGTIQTIYRFGHATASDSQYWFHWAADVDVCRGQVFGDTMERTYYTDGALPKVTDASIALAGGTAYPMNSYTLGVPAPTACSAVAAGSGTGTAETRIYTYTYVTASGEEGKPAPPSTAVTVLPGQSVDLSTLAVAPVGNYNIATKRIYRTSSVGESAAYLFVAEIPVATVTYSDTVLTENLGETLPSNSYSMPPAELKGLVSMPNGMMAGFTGQDVYFCEPYKPYAWPVGFSMSVDYDVVALGVIDTTLVVLTTGTPYIMQGSSPDLMSQIKTEIDQACVSKRSVAFLGGAILYASPDGMFAIGSGAPVHLTAATHSNEEWRALKPSSIHGYVFDGRYIGFYDTGTVQGGFIIDPKLGEFTTLNWYATAGHYDPQRDALFLVVSGALVKFSAGTGKLTVTWRSKKFYTPQPVNYGAIRIEAQTYPVSAQVFADGVSVGTFSITSGNGQRIPSGFEANVWDVEITATSEVYSMALAQTMKDLLNG